MSHTFHVNVYSRRAGGQVTWRTVGLGEFNRTHTGSSRVKLQRKLVEKLREAVRDADPADMDLFRVHRGTTMKRVLLDFGVRGDTGRARFSGTVPLVLEPRWINETEQITVVFHPLHEDEWFLVRDEDDLTSRAQQYLRHAWSGKDRLEELKSDGKDQLRSISFSADPPRLKVPEPETRFRRRRTPENVLSRIGSDQTQRAIEHTLPIGMPRRPYREHMQLLLCGQKKRPTMVVGLPGVGKTTIVNRWIADLVVDDQFDTHRNLDKIHKVWRVSGKRLIAGMSYLGDWEQRCLDLIRECKQKNAILWVDDVHLWGRLGQTRQSDRHMAEFFRGPLMRSEVLMVGECTPTQLARLEDDAPSFAALFTKVRLTETSPRETLPMLVHESRSLEQSLPIEFHPFTYRAILEMSAGMFPWTAMPGKALDMLRQLAARAEPAQDGERQVLAPSTLVAMLSSQTGLPENLLTLEARLDPKLVREAIERNIIGQPDAIDAACDLISRVRSGLPDPKRPLATYLFTGPTGTGKTELAKVLAEYLYGSSARMLRFDMSEFSASDAPARLIGDRWTPEGYLTQRIREQPFSVVLLDEIEKAHQSVLYLLLQLFDEGRLTDAAGNTAGFQNAVVIMTSNLGAQATRPIGFGEETRGMMADISRAVREFFPPELFNRIDRVVPFRPLNPEAAETIATKELAKLLGRRGLVDRNIFAYANRAVKTRIVREAFDPRLGARTVKRYLEDAIGGLLTEQITAGKRARMEVYRIYESSGSLALYVDALAEAAAEPAQFPMEDIVSSPVRQLLPIAKQALERLDQAEAAGSVEAAIERARDSAAVHELYYYIDELQSRIESTRAALARVCSGGRPLPQDPSVVELVAEVSFLVRNLPTFDNLAAHSAWVEVTQIGKDPRGYATNRFADSMEGLIDWLAATYAQVRSDWLDGFGCLLPNGKIRWKTDGASQAIGDALALRPTRIALKLSGLFAHDFFSGEVGSHIWQPPSAEPEIVRVDVTAPASDVDPRTRIESRVAAAANFERALDAGAEPLPENPLALLSAVRSLRFRLPLRAGDVFTVDIEDFRTSVVAQHNVTHISAAIRRLLLSWRGRRVPEACDEQA